MFDKMIINAQVDSYTHAQELIRSGHLQRCMEGGRVFYQSSALANLQGVSMKLDGGRLQIKCSLHKQHSRLTGGRLDNTGMFTVGQARRTVCELFGRWDVDIGCARVTYFEIGLNIPVRGDPMEYIALMESAGPAGSRELFCDANFEKNRQKTTDKRRTVRKYFKVYDKGFEAREKGRECEGNILRVETVYRRQDIPLGVLMEPEYTDRLTGMFCRDWLSVEFRRRVSAVKGVKASQLERAACIMRTGAEAYLREAKARWRDGSLTGKQYRTMREFAQNWEKVRHMFALVPDSKEIEYRDKLFALTGEARK